VIDTKFHYFIIARARQVFNWWPERKKAKARARVQDDVYICEGCGHIVVENEHLFETRYVGAELGDDSRAILDKVEVDHIDPVVATGEGWEGYDVYFTRLFCPADNLQVLCTMCHKFKTLTENDERRYNRAKPL
jgi:hypothetical protein